MRRAYLIPVLLAGAVVVSMHWSRSQTAQTGAAPADGPLSFKITFGERQERIADYSGSISLSEGRVTGLNPWRFFGDDKMDGPNAWKLATKRIGFENQPDQPRPISTPGPTENVVPEGLFVSVEAPATARAHVATTQGSFDIPLADLQPDRVLWFLDGGVTVQRTPAPAKVSVSAAPEENDYPAAAIARNGTVWVAWQGYQSGGDHVYTRHSTAAGWSETFRLTNDRGDIFHTAIGEDSEGRVWVVWSERSDEDWDLRTRSYDGRQWSAVRKLTSGDHPNIFHRLVGDHSGALHLVWVAYRNGESHVLWSKLRGNDWSKPVEISGSSAWMPDAAADSANNLYVAWDSYRAGNYDIFLRKIAADGTMGPVQQVTKSPRFQANASVAVDLQDRVWLAWDESGSNWGKDWAHDDTLRGTVLYRDRRPRIAVLENGAWKQPVADVKAAMPLRYNRFIENPRLACDANGRIWVALQGRTATSMNRTDYWANNGRWERFLTSYEGNHWTPAMPVPNSSSRPDGSFELRAGPRALWSVWASDNRAFGIPDGEARRNAHWEIDAAPFVLTLAARPAEMEAFAEPPGSAAAIHGEERADVARMRAYRTPASSQKAALAGMPAGGATYRILRGDFHRHTEISPDGAGDGSVEDYFRYMLDAAQMDTGIITDHNAGQNNEYTWWRTEKAHDLFHIRGRYTPLFGYERSVNYPNGHRNLVFAQRGVLTLPIGQDEQQAKVNSGSLLYPYLKQHRGIGMLHSLATDQGSDYRDNDPEVEPLVEIYQGYHANYEYEGAPRAESKGYSIDTHGPFRPAGFYWNALAKGLKLGVQSSSDHIATHTSYTMIYTPSEGRKDIVESMRKRHVYGATDNILLDFQAVDAKGIVHMMGDAFEAAAAPRLSVKVTGTGPLMKVEIVKDGKFVFQTEPRADTAEFTYLDNDPGKAESYYYVRVIQVDRNLAWSSPIWVKYTGQ